MQGYRTYIIAALVGIAGAAHYLGYIDQNTMMTLLAILNGSGLATLRAAISPPTE